MKRLNENAVLDDEEQVAHDHRRRSTVPDGGVDGVIIAQGGSTGGWSPVHQGRPAQVLLQRARHRDATPSPPTRRCPPASRRSAPTSPTTVAGSARAAPCTLFTGDTKIGEGRVERTMPFMFSMDETADVGSDAASPVSPEYGPTDNEFTGTIEWVRIDLGDDDHDHLITDEHQMHVAMMRQ